jgi:hypothetical protein
VTPTLSIPGGASPVMIVGANGTGKSTLGADLAGRGAIRIAARRGLEMADEIEFQSLEKTQKQRQQRDREYGRHRLAVQTDAAFVMGNCRRTTSRTPAESGRRSERIRTTAQRPRSWSRNRIGLLQSGRNSFQADGSRLPRADLASGSITARSRSRCR